LVRVYVVCDDDEDCVLAVVCVDGVEALLA
jgi:hypothetical protein